MVSSDSRKPSDHDTETADIRAASPEETCRFMCERRTLLWRDVREDAQARIMEKLITLHYVDDSRYTESFVHDKIRYNKWGRRKIEQALWMKKVDSAISSPILDAVEDEEYLEVLRPLLASKYRTIKAESDYERSMKLIKFAMGRGFTMDLIRRCIDEGVVAADDDVDFVDDDTDD